MQAQPSSQRTLIVLNPRSGACRDRPQIAAELRAAGGANVEVQTTRDLEHLQGVCANAAAQGVQRVGAVGGDGTASAMATALASAYAGTTLPTLALLRGGTMNTIARCLGVPSWPVVKLMQHWLRAPERTTRVAPLRVGSSLGFLFGVGLFPRWLEAYYEAGKGRPTARTAAAMTLRTAMSSLVGGRLGRRVVEPIEVDIETDGDVWPREAFMGLMAGAVDEVGLSFRVFPHAIQDPERVDFIALRSPGWKLALAMPEMFLRRAGLPPAIHEERLVKEAVVRSTNGPLLYSLDGDLHRTVMPLSISRGPVFPMASFRN